MRGIWYDPLVVGTFQRLFEISAFLDVVDEATPTLEASASQELERLAEQEQWEYSDYAPEKMVLDAKFHTWVPTLAAYSVVIMLHSIVETQLRSFAERQGREQGAKLLLKDVAGRGLQQAALYLQRVVSVPVTEDPAWSLLLDVQLLRNVIVHRGGQCSDPPDEPQLVSLIRKYPNKLRVQEADGMRRQVWVSMHLCRELAREVEAFFERLFKAAGLPNRHMQKEV